MRSMFLILVMAASAFSAYVTNTASGRFRDSLKVDSLRNAMVVGTDAAGKFQKRDSVRAAHVADTALHVPTSDSVPYADTAGYALTAGNAMTYSTTSDCDTFVMWRNDSMFTISRCDSMFPTVNPSYHLHTSTTLPDSLNHHVTALRIPVSLGGRLWRTTNMRYDTAYGDVFFPRNFYLGDTTTGVISLYMGALGTYSDVNLDRTALYISTYGGGVSSRGSYLLLDGCEGASKGTAILQSSDSADAIIASTWRTKTVVSGGAVDLNLSYEGGTSSDDGLRLYWNNVSHDGFHLFSRDTLKYLRISQAFTTGSDIQIGRTLLLFSADTGSFNYDHIVNNTPLSVFNGHISSYRVFQDSIWHAYGGFRDSSVTISITSANDWQQVTNAAHTLWGGEEHDGIFLSGDTMIFAHGGVYHGTAKICYSALDGKDFSIRFYNVTQSDSVGQDNIPSTTGVGNIQCVTQPIYLEITTGDMVLMQITCNTDGTDPVIKSARFELSYLHD